MPKKLRTLYLTANGMGATVITADTVLRGILGYSDGAQAPRFLRKYPKIVNTFAHLRQFYDNLSYVGDWRDAFTASPRLQVEVCNYNNLGHLAKCLFRIRSYDLIIISHVAAGDNMAMPLRIAGVLARRTCPMLVFIGNEYDLLEDKIEFIRLARAERICSQLPLRAAQYLYQGIDSSRLLSMPHALNPKVYYPPETGDREIDIGFVGDIYWPFVGDEERTNLIYLFKDKGELFGLRCEIRAGQSMVRLPRDDWAAFLRRSKGLIGAESGTYYLNDHGKLLTNARDYNLKTNLAASFDEVFNRFYAGVPRGVSGKSVSSRHFESIGTKTCQLLLEGDYNGTLTAGEHFIPIKTDLSNIADAIREFKDAEHRHQIAETAYHHVMAEHTYAKRVEYALNTLF